MFPAVLAQYPLGAAVTITNPGFETGNLTGWNEYDPDNQGLFATESVAGSGLPIGTGTYQAALNRTSISTGNVVIAYTNSYAVAPGEIVSAQLRIRRSGLAGCAGNIAIGWYTSASVYISTSDGADIPVGDATSTLGITATAPAGARLFNVQITNNSTATDRWITFDNVTVTKLPAHPFNLELNGVDLIDAVPMESVQIEMAAPGTNGSMSFVIVDPTSSVTVREWDEVRFIEHAATRPILFGGFVQSVRLQPWAATGRNIAVDVVGYGVLLDRKVVVSAAHPTDADGNYLTMGPAIAHLVSLCGGRVSAQSSMQGLGVSVNPDIGVADPVNMGFYWYTKTEPLPAVAVAYLRDAISAWGELAGDTNTDWVFGESTAAQPAPPLAWVDAYARLICVPDISTENTNVYLGNAPVNLNTSGAGGTTTVAAAEYERENSDAATSAYVTGGTGAGVGWVRQPPFERAGDLETIVSDSDSTTAAYRDQAGTNEIEALLAAVERGGATVVSGSPINFLPGQKITWTMAALGLSAATFRITGVSISFASPDQRQYSLSLGRRAAARPSFASRSGRYVVRRPSTLV